ncbi:MAG: alpha-ketoacid dehydrogenase subunit beta [Nitrososphaerota archaeon]|nr:alpha-ketoacid dehydrogenase subunit beta [Nitrososphaerota archaeon]
MQQVDQQQRNLTFLQAITEALSQEMERDKSIVVMGEDVRIWGGVFGRFKGFREKFGDDRVLDTPISEAGFVGAGVGAAATGLRPVVDLMFVDFFGVAGDQIVNQAAKMKYMFGGKAKIPLVIITMIGGGLSAAAQHSECLYSVFAHIPGIKCVVPSTAYDAKGLLTTALRQDDPVMFFEHKFLHSSTEGRPVPKESYAIQFGKADIKREGTDVTIVGLARTVHQSLEAAQELQTQGISAEVLDLRTIVPMDEQAILDSVKKTGRLVVVDEDYPRCNIATDVAALVASKGFNYLDSPIGIVSSLDTPPPFSPVLEEAFLPSVEKIVQSAKAAVHRT